jgi:hypothetical protein
MGLFAVNTGCRDGAVCSLQCDWEVRVPELQATVFMVPGRLVKNGDERLMVLNQVAQSVIADSGTTIVGAWHGRKLCSRTHTPMLV